jgi:hypothetical protein
MILLKLSKRYTKTQMNNLKTLNECLLVSNLIEEKQTPLVVLVTIWSQVFYIVILTNT